MSDKLHDLPLITFIMLRHAFSFDNRASLSYFVNIPNAEVVVNPSTSRSIPTYPKTPQRGYEIGMVELSGGYLTFDMPRYLKDHIKGFCGCRDLLNDICLRYSLGDFKIMRHLRVWFLHCHGVDWVITKVQNGIGDGNDNVEEEKAGNIVGSSRFSSTSHVSMGQYSEYTDEYETYWVEFTALFNNRRKREARSPTQLYNILSIEIGLSASSFYRRQKSPRRASIDKIIEWVEKEENK
ncbi:hypothetical protein C1646_765008 [Rhizophagus diaphanus]|nr:hypothetical protein C1646_765008 [Rhizophagus diaphanus] [Rhizophagus sp. MUCL 43196]